MTSTKSPVVRTLLLLYLAVSVSYQLVASVSLLIGYFELRSQIEEPFQVDPRQPKLSRVSALAKQAGLAAGDTLESINGLPYSGRALWQKIRWYAHPHQPLTVTVRRGVHQPFTRSLLPVGFPGSPFAQRTPTGSEIREAVFILFLHIVVPLFCLALGYWVVLARPSDLNAWLILILLSYPEAHISVSTFNWLPGPWLVLRLGWHLALEAATPVALLWLGLLFPKRSRLDAALPWLKWTLFGILSLGLLIGLVTDYWNWYAINSPNPAQWLEPLNDRVLNWAILACLILYWVALLDQFRSEESPDATRRLRVLFAGSVLGLGNLLVVWALLPRFGIDPSSIQWLGYLSAVLMLVFPLSLAYVVIVQRAMDLPILVRIGTRYILARTTLVVLELSLIACIAILFLIPALASGHQPARLSLSGLAVAALVWLLFTRRSPGDRVRAWLDRRFFREAYDAERILSELANHARSIADPRELITTVSRQISDVLHVSQVAVLLRYGTRFRLEHVIGLSAQTDLVFVESTPLEELARTNSSQAWIAGRPAGIALTAHGSVNTLSQMEADLLLPLPGRSRLLGAMALGPKRSEETYTPSDLRLLESISIQAGLGLELSEMARSLADAAAQRARVEREIEIAREVQERLFPQRLPTLPDATIAGHCRPALVVGGDYYDVLELPAGKLGLAIGDVSGKGIAAALLMATLRASLRTATLAGFADLPRLMQMMNQLVFESSTANRYATFFFSVFDPATRTLRYVNAGHNPPVLLRRVAGGAIDHLRLEAGGPVIGLLPGMLYTEGAVSLQSGDLFLGYTDGISEAMNAVEDEWGDERMISAADSVFHLPAAEILPRILAAADRFTAAAEQHDDMTLLILKFA